MPAKSGCSKVKLFRIANSAMILTALCLILGICFIPLVVTATVTVLYEVPIPRVEILQAFNQI